MKKVLFWGLFVVFAVLIVGCSASSSDSDELSSANPSKNISEQADTDTADSDEPTSVSPSKSAGEQKNTSSETTGQKNAVAKAKAYLDYTAFSHDGLVEQFEYEKFSHEEAVYAADNCGADWNEQAAKKAKSYLEYTSFSRDGLIQQLEYEKFSHEQTVYGAEANGY